jgi:hypothetical protein
MLNDIFWGFIDFSVLLLELTTLYVVFNILSEVKTSKKSIRLSLILMVIIMYCLRRINISPCTRVLILIISSCIFYKINYQVSFAKCITITLMFFLVLIGIEAIGISIVATLGSVEISTVSENNLYKLEAIVFSKSSLIVIILYSNYILLAGKVDARELLYVCIPIFTNILSLLIIFEYSIEGSYKKLSYNYDVILISFLLLLSSMSLLWIVYKIIKSSKVKLEHELIREKIDMECNYYVNVENNQERVKSLYHDMKNHMICIGNLDDIEKVREYIKDINLELNSIENSFNTGNKIVDILMSEKKNKCIEKGIKFECFLDFSKLDFINMKDICSILSNALDNAINACDKIKDSSILKYICIKVTYVNNFCVINIENSKINKVLKRKKCIITDKKDKFVHGIGIKNIKATVSKYDGEVNINYTDEKFLLTVMIPIKKCSILSN